MARRTMQEHRRLVPPLAAVLLAGCVGSSASPWREPPPPPAPAGAVDPVFCYRTLAEVSCYFARDRSVPGQLVAVYARPVGDPASATYWRKEAAREAEPDARASEPERP
ncbi:MAG: hypothetical protein NZP72_03350 [Geminicoccaceae bacterium]|nr:hypothetical protein [Geminicoccaceae bacterium]